MGEKDSLATKASCLCSLAKRDKRACRTMSDKVNQEAKPWTCKMVRRRKQKKCAANMRYGFTRPTVSSSQVAPKPDEDSSESVISEGTVDRREEVDETLIDEDEDELEEVDDDKDKDKQEETDDERVEDSSDSVTDDDEDEPEEVDEATSTDPTEKCLEKDSLATKASCLCSLAKRDKRACRTM